MSLPLQATIERNKTSTKSAMLWLLDVMLDTPFYVTNNNENVTYNNQLYMAFPFSVGDITDDGKETPSIQLKISNITRDIGVVVSGAGGGGGTEIVLRVVNYKLINGVSSMSLELEETFQITKTQIDAYWVTFTISIPRDLTVRFPMRTVLKNFCPYRFKDIECGYIGEETVCNKTLSNCRERNNSRRFGGEPGLVGNLG